ncbi:MAG: hypothetical protein JWR20_2792 [Marmoricola sp.]|nr:hypothetical protein [Marmoricola sp.]
MSDDDQPVPGQDPGGVPGGDPSGAPGTAGAPGAGAGPGEAREEVGSVGEEAAKLFGVLSDWARDAAPHDTGGHAGPGASHGHSHGDPHGDPHGQAHGGPTGEDCHWCPVCRAAHLVRRTNPEVKMHLAQAASSLVQAAAGLLATQAGQAGGDPSQQVQKIDLDDDSDWDEDR